MGEEIEPEYEYSKPKQKYGLSKAYFKKILLDERRNNRRVVFGRLVAKFRKIYDRITLFAHRWLPWLGLIK